MRYNDSFEMPGNGELSGWKPVFIVKGQCQHYHSRASYFSINLSPFLLQEKVSHLQPRLTPSGGLADRADEVNPVSDIAQDISGKSANERLSYHL